MAMCPDFSGIRHGNSYIICVGFRHVPPALPGVLVMLDCPRHRLRHAPRHGPRHAPRHGPRAFTLVELLVVIGIIALLISILLPALQKAKDQASRVACLSSMRQVGTFFTMYAQQYKDAVPIG